MVMMSLEMVSLVLVVKDGEEEEENETASVCEADVISRFLWILPASRLQLSGALVLITLFIGVVTSSMEQAQIKQEKRRAVRASQPSLPSIPCHAMPLYALPCIHVPEAPKHRVTPRSPITTAMTTRPPPNNARHRPSNACSVPPGQRPCRPSRVRLCSRRSIASIWTRMGPSLLSS